MPTVRPGVILKISETLGILGCINEHDGSGYIHCLLEAYHPAYARLKSEHYRTNLAKSVRIGAVGEILKSRFSHEPELTNEARNVFALAMAYGIPLPQELMEDYSRFLRIGYRLYNADMVLIEEVRNPDSNGELCNIINTQEDEYHLLVRILDFEDDGKVRFEILGKFI